MTNYYEDNDDLHFYIDKAIDWAQLVTITEGDLADSEHYSSVEEAVEFYKEIFTLVGAFSANEITPVAKEIDQIGLTYNDGEITFPDSLQSIFDQIKKLDLHGMCLPREIGGLNVPVIAYMINSELMARADVSVMAHHGFHAGIAMALMVYSVMEGSTKIQRNPLSLASTRFQEAVMEIARGEAWGSMDITEPDAGSDMAKLRTKGEQDAAGNWFVTGQKIFITSGHGKYHIVIAKTEDTDESDDFAGLKGLSLFLVPAWEEQADGRRRWLVRFERLEEKLGHTGSATVAVNFDRSPAELIGKRGDGFKYMLLLMNNARISVGFECLGLIESATRMARAYASERRSMGKAIDQHEMIADYLEEMETDAQAIRAMAMYAAFHEEMVHKINIRLLFETDEAKIKALKSNLKQHKIASRRTTPLLKYYASEKAVEHARNNIQIHGGVGYTKEYDAEKLLRDAMVFPIYEGTSQIQALMAMKDTLMNVMKHPVEFTTQMAKAKAQRVTAKDPLVRRVARIQSQSCDAIRFLMTQVAVGKVKDVRQRPMNRWMSHLLSNWNPKTDFAPAMLHAERLIQILIDEFVAERLLDQAKQFPERRELLMRFLERAESRVLGNLHRIMYSGEHLLRKLSKSMDNIDNMDNSEVVGA